MAQTTNATMFVLTVLAFFGQIITKEEEFVSTRVVGGFAATKNSWYPTIQLGFIGNTKSLYNISAILNTRKYPIPSLFPGLFDGWLPGVVLPGTEAGTFPDTGLEPGLDPGLVLPPGLGLSLGGLTNTGLLG